MSNNYAFRIIRNVLFSDNSERDLRKNEQMVEDFVRIQEWQKEQNTILLPFIKEMLERLDKMDKETVVQFQSLHGKIDNISIRLLQYEKRQKEIAEYTHRAWNGDETTTNTGNIKRNSNTNAKYENAVVVIMC